MRPPLRLVGGWGDSEDEARGQDAPTVKQGVPEDEQAFLVAFARAMRQLMGVTTTSGGSQLVGPALSVRASIPAPSGVSLENALAGWGDEMTARGCRPGSTYRMSTLVRRVAKFSGWQGVAHVTYSDCVAFLASQRRGDKPWSGPTYDQAVSTLRTFGEFCRRSGWVSANPLMDLQACGEPGEHGSRALTTLEARAIIASSIDRHLRSRRAKGYAPIFWLFMFHTGLRYAETQGIRWKDLDLEASTPAVHTDPKAIGNKARRRDRIPLHPELLEMLQHIKASSGTLEANARVFLQAPTRTTWRLDRDSAKVAARDSRGRPVTPHSCRKSFCTWLDSQSIPRGLVSRLARHAQTLTEEKYIDHDSSLEAAAIQALPRLWPEGVKIFARNLEKDSCLNGNAGDTQGVKQPSPITDSTALPRPLARAASHHSVEGSGSAVAFSAVPGRFSRAIESDNGHFTQVEKACDLNADPLPGAIAALSMYVNARLNGSQQESDHGRKHNQAG